MAENQKKHVDGMGRRALLLGTAATLIPVAGKTDWSSPNAPADTIIDILNKFTFTGQDGGSVNAVLRTLKNKPVTVSFAYRGCSTQHIPMHETLSRLEKQASDLVHIVIDTNPEVDNLEQGVRDGLLNELHDKGNMHNKIVILYPRSSDLTEIQESLGLIPNPVPQSIVEVGLFGRDGKQIGFESTSDHSPQDIISKWQTQLSAGRGR